MQMTSFPDSHITTVIMHKNAKNHEKRHTLKALINAPFICATLIFAALIFADLVHVRKNYCLKIHKRLASCKNWYHTNFSFISLQKSTPKNVLQHVILC